jgi:hypothetical protein
MAILDKLHSLTRDELASLKINAERLGLSGTVKEKAAASTLLPAIAAEVATRKVRATAERSELKKQTQAANVKSEQ